MLAHLSAVFEVLSDFPVPFDLFPKTVPSFFVDLFSPLWRGHFSRGHILQKTDHLVDPTHLGLSPWMDLNICLGHQIQQTDSSQSLPVNMSFTNKCLYF